MIIFRCLLILLSCSDSITNVQSLSLRPSILFSSMLNRINGDVSVDGDTSDISSPLSAETFTPEIDEIEKDDTSFVLSPFLATTEQQPQGNLIRIWSGAAGAAALRQVQFLASKASESTDAMEESKFSLAKRRRLRMMSRSAPPPNANMNDDQTNSQNLFWKDNTKRRRKPKYLDGVDPVGEGGGIFNNAEFNTLAQKAAVSKLKRSDLAVSSSDKREEQVWTALANLELDSKYTKHVRGHDEIVEVNANQ